MKRGELLIVTGANGMLGNVLIDHFANKEKLEIISIDLSKKKERVYENELYYSLDVSSEDRVKNLFSNLEEKVILYQDIGLINLAALSVFEDFELRDKKSFMRVLEVNLYGTFNMIQNTVKLVKKSAVNSSIVNTSSIFAQRSPDERNYIDLNRKNSEVYGASKAGVEQMTRYFAAHLAKYNIRVNCVSPGGILNEKDPQGEKFQKLYNNKVPMARMGYNKEMIGAYDFLLNNSLSKYVTGQTIHVDGGYTAW